ncbi:phage tail spike protein [Ignavigranum ruoffiae]|uniref:phage tail spike protein n=1 Tax=Ignavigranum ruoffiae TaxID=89093 RepID=UPI003AFF7B73
MIRLFNNQEQLIKIVRKDAIRVLKHKQILTDENYISDQLFVELLALDEQVIQDMEFIAIPTQEDPFVHHLFFIVETKTEGNITTITGVQSGIEELRKIPVYDQRPQNYDVRQVVERLLEGTNWRANYVADGKVSTNFYYISVFEALKKACLSANVEMQFFVEVRSTRIGARYIDFKKRTGKDIGKRVVYGHNALKIVKEDSKTNLITALIGRGKGEQISSAEENESGQAGYGRKITFKDIVWRTSEGKPLNKPAGQEYLEDPEATLLYGIKTQDGNLPKIGFVEFQDVEDPEILIQLTYEKLLELNRPQVLMKTDSLYLTETGIGDTIRVVRPDRNLDYKTRVFEIEWDRLTNATTDMKLGDKINSNEQKRQASMMAKVAENLTNFLGNEIEQLVTSLPSADGFNRNYYTDLTPENPKIGDLWFKPDPRYEGKLMILTWNGTMWEEIMSEDLPKEIQAKFEEIDGKVADMMKSIADAEINAKIALEQSGAGQTLANEFEKIISEGGYGSLKEAIGDVSEVKLETLSDRVRTMIYNPDGSLTINEQTAKFIKDSVITDDYISNVVQTSDLVQSEIKKILPVPTDEQIAEIAKQTQLTKEDIQAMFTDGFLSDTDIKKIAEQTGMSVEDIQKIVSDKINAEMVQQYEKKIVTKYYIKDDVPRSTYEGYVDGIGNFKATDYKLINYIEPGDYQVEVTHNNELVNPSLIALSYIKDDGSESLLFSRYLNKGEYTTIFNFKVPELTYVWGNRDIVVKAYGDAKSIYALKVSRQVEVNIPIRENSGSISSRITQLNNNINLALFGSSGAISRLNVGEDGIYLKGETIKLDGNVEMDNAFIKNLMVNKMTADTVTAYMGQFNQIIANHIDAKSISGYDATWVMNTFNGINSRLKITGDAITMVDNTGYSTAKFLDFGMQVFRKGERAGWFQTYKGGVAVIADKGNDLVLGYREDNNSTGFGGVLRIQAGVQTSISFKQYDIIFDPGNGYVYSLRDMLSKLGYANV